MKKRFAILSLFIMVIPMLYIPKTNAETLGDLEAKLNKKQQELDETNNKKAQTQAEINTVNQNITNIKN